jgi:hypothetical protein
MQDQVFGCVSVSLLHPRLEPTFDTRLFSCRPLNSSMTLTFLQMTSLFTVITDPEDPKFDLEALINSWTEAKA